jgi:acyl carrier protein
VTLVDEDGEPVPDDEIGEIVVRSRYIALGYWRDPALTAAAFSTDPVDPTIRTLRTRDLARRRPDGLFEFHGRKDFQVKIDGFRVEPGEIEAVVRRLNGVRDCAVVVRRDDDGRQYALVGYCELEKSTSGLLPRHIQAQLREKLPHYMVPARIFIVDALPRLPTFKLDRTALLEIDRESMLASTSIDPIVSAVANVFHSILATVVPTPDDTAASLGCDSLQAVTLAIELESRFAVRISSETFDMHESIRSIATRITQRQRESSSALRDGTRTETRASLAKAPRPVSE